MKLLERVGDMVLILGSVGVVITLLVGAGAVRKLLPYKETTDE